MRSANNSAESRNLYIQRARCVVRWPPPLLIVKLPRFSVWRITSMWCTHAARRGARPQCDAVCYLLYTRRLLFQHLYCFCSWPCQISSFPARVTRSLYHCNAVLCRTHRFTRLCRATHYIHARYTHSTMLST